jgi:hypothetical protein
MRRSSLTDQGSFFQHQNAPMIGTRNYRRSSERHLVVTVRRDRVPAAHQLSRAIAAADEPVNENATTTTVSRIMRAAHQGSGNRSAMRSRRIVSRPLTTRPTAADYSASPGKLPARARQPGLSDAHGAGRSRSAARERDRARRRRRSRRPRHYDSYA